MQLRMYDHIVIRKIIGYREIKHFMKVQNMEGHNISYMNLNLVLLCVNIQIEFFRNSFQIGN